MSRRTHEVWRGLVEVVWATREEWRRRVVELTALPFGRVRALRRLANKPLTLSELAISMTTDAPAATVAVNDLEARGLVERMPHPTSGRMKLVKLTAAGRKLVDKINALDDDPPPAFAALPAADLAAVQRMVDALGKHD